MKKVSSKKPAYTRRPLTMALASVLLLSPAAAWAEPMLMIPLANNPDMSRYDTNYLELGGFYNSNGDSGAFGEHNGVRDEGGYFIGNMNLMNRDDKTATYYNLLGRNLGLDSRQIGGNFGHQGKYGLFAEFSQFDHLTSDSTQFIFNGLGGSILTLPGGFGSVATNFPPADQAKIAGALKSYDIEQKRNVYKFGGNVFFNGETEGLVSFRVDDRRGDNLIGARIGASSAVLMPRPIDDNTQQMEAKLRWNTEKAQLEGIYYFSKYSNNNETLTWFNPYTTSTSPTGRMSLDPDNYFHQIQLSGGYNFTPTTRLTGVVSYGMMRQDDTFSPYVVEGNTVNNYNQPGLPRNSLDAAVDNLLLDLKLTTRLFNKLNVKATYNYNDYNNKTPTNQYYPVLNDGTTQQALNPAYRNTAVSSTQNKFGLDASYPLGAGFTLRGYYTYKRVDYSPEEDELRSYIDDNIAGVEVLKRASAWVTGSLKYEYQQRRGAGFWDNTTAGLPRQYYIADYDQNKLQGKVFLTPADALSFSLTGDWYQRDYQNQAAGNGMSTGLQRGIGQSYTIDGQWTPINGFSAYAFYTWSQMKMDQTGGTTAVNTWGATLDNQGNTIGLGVRYVPESRKYDVGVQYVWDDNSSPISDMWAPTGPGTVTQPTALPDVKYRMDYVQLYGSYMLDKNIKLRLNCAYAHLRGADWRYDDVNVTAPGANGVIFANQTASHYNDFLVGLTVTFSWD